MLDKEIQETRCMIARIANIPPDDITVTDLGISGNILFNVFLKESGWNYGIFFSSKPTISYIEDVMREFNKESEKWAKEDLTEEDWMN